MPTSEETVLSRIRDAAESGATHLDLSRSVLETLPPEIGELTALTTLDLSKNQLTALPPEWASAPPLHRRAEQQWECPHGDKSPCYAYQPR
ncbi:MAG: hypothetical protein Fur0018_17950 [Anaerolineales bacterium]